ncbi:MAG: DUF732 domain-containing protein [Mycobacterium sp.]
MFGKVVLSSAIAIAIAGLATATAAPALADDTDDALVMVIQGRGIPFTTPQSLVELAHATCEEVATGKAPAAVAAGIAGPNGWTPEQSVFYVRAATELYCPA